jgi:hypothetical protein
MCVQEEDRLKASNGGSINCQGQQEKELPEQQSRFSLQAIWQRSPTVSSAHSPSG